MAVCSAGPLPTGGRGVGCSSGCWEFDDNQHSYNVSQPILYAHGREGACTRDGDPVVGLETNPNPNILTVTSPAQPYMQQPHSSTMAGSGCTLLLFKQEHVTTNPSIVLRAHEAASSPTSHLTGLVVGFRSELPDLRDVEREGDK